MMLTDCSKRWLFIIVLSCGLAWPGFYNGFCLFMGDSATYIESWLEHSVMAVRPSFYPFFIGILINWRTIHLVILFQIIFIAIILEILLTRCLELAVSIALLIAITTTVAWWANMLMSDIFFGIAGLGFFVLAFYNGKLSVLERYSTITILLLSLLMHMVIPVLIFAVAILYLIVDFIMRKPLNRMMLALTILALFSWSCFPLLNRVYGNSYTPSTGLYKFIAARMAGDGLISPQDMEYFARNAPERIVKLKEQMETIQRTVTPNYQRIQVVLFDPISPFLDWEQDQRVVSFKEIVKTTLRKKPLQNMSTVLAGASRLWTYPEIPTYIVEAMGPQLGLFLEKPFPEYFQRFLKTRQANGLLKLSFWNSIISFCYYFSLIILVLGTAVSVFLSFRWRKRPAHKADNLLRFARFILIFLVLHSIIIYFLAGDFPRYQSRMSWLVGLAAPGLVIALYDRYQQSSRGELQPD
jgi:hypothetical protein